VADLGGEFGDLESRDEPDEVVGAVGCDAESCCSGRRSLGVGRQFAGDDLVAIVQSGSGAVHCADEAARSTTDHGEPEPSAEHLDHRIRFHCVGLLVGSRRRRYWLRPFRLGGEACSPAPSFDDAEGAGKVHAS
jgi:hypothetical protein